MRPNGSPQTLERRRRKALALLTRGLTIGEAARRVGADFSSVYRWQQDVAREGPDALRPSRSPGGPASSRRNNVADCWPFS